MKVLKIDNSGSVLIQAKNLKIWVDVWKEDNEFRADWNQYIFHLDNDKDMEIKKFQEDANNFDEATSIAINYCENNRTIEN